MDKVFGMEKKERNPKPLMYQGVSDTFYPARSDVPFVSTDDGIDFEGEFGVITDAVPINAEQGEGGGAHPAHRADQRLEPAQDRAGRDEDRLRLGAGQAALRHGARSPSRPDELGAHWRDCRVDLPLNVKWNGKQFGAANGYAMSFGFDDLVVHAAYSRTLVAGTVIGSGTVSNPTYREVGSSCIAERRGIEMVDHGKPRTDYMAFGDTVSDGCPAARRFPGFRGASRDGRQSVAFLDSIIRGWLSAGRCQRNGGSSNS